jgi:hypothetical protein
MVLGILGSIYNQIERAWYGLSDALEKRGIPLYAYIDFLEKRGIPSLPFTVALVILLVVFFLSLSAGGSTSVKLVLKIEDEQGNKLSGVSVKVFDEQGNERGSRKHASYGSVIAIENVRPNEVLRVEASKEGYESSSTSVNVSLAKNGQIEIYLTLHRVVEGIEARIRVVDAESGTPVVNAQAFLNMPEGTITGQMDENGIIHFYGVMRGVVLELNITADGYEDLRELVSFDSNEIQEFVLYPRVDSLVGTATLTVLVKDATTRTPLNNVSISVFDAEKDELIANAIEEDGEYSINLSKGMVVRVVVEKEGYATYTSPTPFTIREDESTIEVFLVPGGTALVVKVRDEYGQPIYNTAITLYDETLKTVAKKVLGFSSEAMFSGLNPAKKYYVTAHVDGYLPVRASVDLIREDTVTLTLKAATNENSEQVTIHVVQATGLAASNATLKFYEIIDSEKLPLGISPTETDVDGRARVVLELDKRVRVEAVYGENTGEAEFTVQKGMEEVTIQLSVPESFVKLILQDPNGNPIKGKATVTTKDGEILYQGEIYKGRIWIDANGNKEVLLYIELEDGNTFEQEVYLGDNEEVVITVYSDKSVLYPKIEFLGIFDEDGEEVKAIFKGKFYWLKFKTSWPSGNFKGGVHVRVGNDEVQNVDEQGVGIVGFDGTVEGFMYGKTYTPPTSEQQDRENVGRAGELNKWFEAYYDSPANVEMLSVKVLAEETMQDTQVTIQWRAWAEYGGRYYRTPRDEELGDEESTENKHGLYAKTLKATVPVFPEGFECNQQLCASFEFIDEDGTRYKEHKFTPDVNKLYVLEIKLLSVEEASTVSLYLSTEKASPSIMFLGYGIDELMEQPQSEEGTLDLVIKDLQLETNTSRSVFVLFKTIRGDDTFIKLLVSAPNTNIEKTLNFTVYEEGELVVELEPKAPNIGEPFYVKVKDAKSLAPVGDATIHIFDSDNKLQKSVVGMNVENYGKNGIYRIPSGLPQGVYTLRVMKKDYKPAEIQFILLISNIIEITGEESLSLKPGETSKTVKFKLKNRSRFTIGALGYEVVKSKGWPKELRLEIIDLPEQLAPDEEVEITVQLTLETEEEISAQAEGEIIITGAIVGSIPSQPVKSKGFKITISINQKLEPVCLKFTPPELDVALPGSPEVSETISLKVKNNCMLDLALKTEIAEGADEGLEITSNALDGITEIAQNEEVTVEFTVTNKVQRNLLKPEKLTVKVKFYQGEKVRTLEKTLTINVTLRDPRLFLKTSNWIIIWMAPSETEGYEGKGMLHVINLGELEIRNLRVVSTEVYDRFGKLASEVQIRVTRTQTWAGPAAIQPNASTTPSPTTPAPIGPTTQSAVVDVLEPKQQLLPPLVVYAEASQGASLTAGPYTATLTLVGEIAGKEYALRHVRVWINASPEKCLKFTAPDLRFESEDSVSGVLTKTVYLHNNCGEVLRDFSVEPNMFGNNELRLEAFETLALQPGQKAKFKLVLYKGGDYYNLDRQETIKIRALLTTTQRHITSNEQPIQISLGVLPDAVEGRSTEPITIPVCDSSTKKEVRLPLTAKPGEVNCEEAYCDAVQFTEYILKKLASHVQNVQSIIKEKGFKTSEFPACSIEKPFCTFTELGIPKLKVVAYLKHDLVSTQLMLAKLDELKQEHPGLKDFSAVEYRDIDLYNYSNSFMFLPHQVFITSRIEGCGRYEILIDGAIQNQQGLLLGENVLAILNVLQFKSKNRKVTSECTYEIQNVMNFLPADRGLNASRHLNTWVGLIEVGPGEKLSQAAEEFAKTLFGESEGRVVKNAGNTNKVKLVLKEMERGRIVRISLGPGRTGEESPKTTIIEINSALESDTEEAKLIAEEAAKAIRMLAEQSAFLDACIDEQGRYLEIRKFKELGKLEVSGDETLRILLDQKSCALLNVQSSTQEKIMLTLDAEELTSTGAVTDVWLETMGGQRITPYNPATGKEGTPIDLTANPQKAGLYGYTFRVCTVGTEHLARGTEKRIKVKAKSISVAGAGREQLRESEWHVVKAAVCGIHPFTLIEKMSELSPGTGKQTYYFIPGWKGLPDKAPIEDMAYASDAWKKLVEEGKAYTGEGSQTPITEAVKSTQPSIDDMSSWGAKGITAYLVACAVAEGICSFLMGGAFVSAFSVLVGCGLPSAWAYLHLIPGGQKIAEALTNFGGKVASFFKPLLDFLRPVTQPVGKALHKIFIDIPSRGIEWIMKKLGSGEDITEKQRQFTDYILPPAVIGVEITSFSQYVAHIGDLDKAGARNASKLVANVFRRGLREELAGAPKKTIDEIVNTTGKKFEDELYKRLYEKGPGAKRTLLDRIRGKKLPKVADVIDDAAKDAWNASKEVLRTELLSNKDKILGSKLGQRLLSLERQAKASLLDRPKIAKEATNKLFGQKTTIEKKALDTAKLAEEAVERSALKDVLSEQELREVRKELRKFLNEAVEKLPEKVAKDDVEEILEKAFLHTERKLKPVFDSAFEKAVEKKVFERLESTMAKNIEEKVLKEAREKATRGFWKKFRSRSAWKRGIWGLACGVAGVTAGTSAAWAAIGQELNKKPVETSSQPAPQPETRTVVKPPVKLLKGVLEGEDVLWKDKLYKLEVWKDDDGKIRYHISGVESDDEFARFREHVTKNPQAMWIEDCDKYREKPLFWSALKPKEENLVKTGIRKEYTTAVIQIGFGFARASVAFKVPEEWLAAVMAVEPSKIEGCNIEDDWYAKLGSKKELEDAENKIYCAAKRLRESIDAVAATRPELKDDALVKEALKKLTSHEDKELYVERVSKVKAAIEG